MQIIISKHQRNFKNNSNEINLHAFKKSKLNYFHQICMIKQKCWSDFLQNAKDKKTFQVYKYIKSRILEKTPFIIFENQTNVDFHKKCNAFVKVLFSALLQNHELRNFDFSNFENFMKWSKSIANKIENSIKTFNSKKVCELNKINFHIIQKTYKKISKLFNFFYIHLIN